MNVVNLLIKPVSGNCNLHCKYCFYRDLVENRDTKQESLQQEKITVMSFATLERIVSSAFATAKNGIIFAFQGGEPTLAGIDFYKRLIELAEKYNEKDIAVSYSLQTNGIVLSDAWCKLFKENNFLIGISLDGYKEIHDLLRYDNNQKGTYAKVMKGIALLQKYKIEYNILTVINQYNYKHIIKIYNFFQKHDFKYLQFIPCIAPIDEVQEQHGFAISPDNYFLFLDQLFQMWYKDILDGKKISIRYFDNLVGIMLGFKAQSCDLNNMCSYNLIIESNGNVYPCDFYVLDRYKTGNIITDDILTIINSPKTQDFIEESKIIDDKCMNCRFYRLCMGGCKRHRNLPNNDIIHENFFCNSYYKFFDKNIDKLENLARFFRKSV